MSKEKVIYAVETGFLLDKTDPEYDCYNEVYDKKHGFFNDGNCVYPSEEEADDAAKTYVEEGDTKSYAIISILTCDESLWEEMKAEIENDESDGYEWFNELEGDPSMYTMDAVFRTYHKDDDGNVLTDSLLEK